MWPVRFTEAARAELSEAQDWYEAEVPGLGRRFRAEIDSAVPAHGRQPRAISRGLQNIAAGAHQEISLRAVFPHRAGLPFDRRLFSRQPRSAPVETARLSRRRPLSPSLDKIDELSLELTHTYRDSPCGLGKSARTAQILRYLCW